MFRVRAFRVARVGYQGRNNLHAHRSRRYFGTGGRRFHRFLPVPVSHSPVTRTSFISTIVDNRCRNGDASLRIPPEKRASHGWDRFCRRCTRRLIG
uniref:Uncharacterized protein n=1 Tax=Candidatus Kentrum sp. SD TaxID=2126332 RepID=A0A451BPU8_9GAMM|nr:MAG: hypothetical protein BECKSD772D_GA0070982_110010 [Candidatus Kentron sp. SD]